MGTRVIDIDIVLEHGQLVEVLRNEDDRLEMIRRMREILDGPDGDVRQGLIQVLVDQFMNADSHEPIIVRTGTFTDSKGVQDDEDHLRWNCTIDDFDVDIDEYPNSTKTPRKNLAHKDVYKFHGLLGPKKKHSPKGQSLESHDFEDKAIAKNQKFYKFSAKVGAAGPGQRVLDPCVICDR